MAYKQLPVPEVADVPDQRRRRQLFRNARGGQELQPNLLRQAIACQLRFSTRTVALFNMSLRPTLLGFDLSIPNRGFTAVVSVFTGTPPAKPFDCKSAPYPRDVLGGDRRAHPTGGEPRLSHVPICVGIPTEAVLAQMRTSDPPVRYRVGTPRGRLTHYEEKLAQMPWQVARQGVSVKLRPDDSELYILAESQDQVNKERAMRRRQLKSLWKRFQTLQAMKLTRDRRLRDLAPGLTPRAVLEKFAIIPMLDVHLRTTDQRLVVLTRYTHPEKDVEVLLNSLKLQLPAQPPPKIVAPPPAGGAAL